MKHVKISLKAEMSSRAAASELLSDAGDAVLIQRGSPRWLLLRCPCGCGETIPLNLDARAGKAWRLYRGRATGVSLFPSVWRDTGCQSHFIVWRDSILMIGAGYGRTASPRDDLKLGALSRRVLDVWPRGRLASYVEIADVLQEIPWDVQEVCHNLVDAGELVEAIGHQRGWFRKMSG
jgi:hypothetical protein